MTEPKTFSPSDAMVTLVKEGRTTARHRAFVIEWQGDKVWVKDKAPYNYYHWHKVQKIFATLFRIPMLRPTVSIGGQEGLYFEFSRLVQLHKKGVPVARPVALGKGWLATCHFGTPLQDLLDQEDSLTDREKLLITGAQALAKLHQDGEWHGSGQVRDLVKTSNGVGFIDFEEDLLAEMTLVQAQARDILLFLISAARYASLEHNPLPAALSAYQQIAPEAVWPELKRLRGLTRFFGFLLKPWRQKLGRDARQALLAVEALEGHI
ncbi:MAG: hypothetical protein OQJ97_02590 [Rhodospirillales bacterium]|nr:hypothetical protein [Rhodospirillales bacterium]